MMLWINCPSLIRFPLDKLGFKLKLLTYDQLHLSVYLAACLVVLFQKLADLSTTPNPRLIDGILLTKFDTIDDKVDKPLES